MVIPASNAVYDVYDLIKKLTYHCHLAHYKTFTQDLLLNIVKINKCILHSYILKIIKFEEKIKLEV